MRGEDDGDVLGQLGLAFGALRDPSCTPLPVGRCPYSFLRNLGLTVTNRRQLICMEHFVHSGILLH